MTNIQLYADNIKVEAQRDTMNVWLDGVDINLLVTEIGTKELLDAIVENNDLGTVADYLHNREQEDE